MKRFFDVAHKKPFKMFYNIFVPRKVRKQWSFEYLEIPIQAQLAEYWKAVIKRYDQGEIAKFDLKSKKDLSGKKIIWQYWGQGIENANDTAKLCFASVDKFKGDYEVIRITDDNLHEYLDFPEFVVEKRLKSEFRPVFFSDLLRVALINVYGGIWLDASILLTAPIPERFAAYDFFMFSRDPNSDYKVWGKNDTHFYFSWRDDFKVRYLSSIIYGKQKSALSAVLLDLLLYFWRSENTIPHYFFFQIMINEVCEFEEVLFDFPVADDTLPHLLQWVMNKKFNADDYKLILKSSDIHKLSLHVKLKEKDTFGNLTYYGKLKAQLFDQES